MRPNEEGVRTADASWLSDPFSETPGANHPTFEGFPPPADLLAQLLGPPQ